MRFDCVPSDWMPFLVTPASNRPATTSLPHFGFTQRVQPTHKTLPFRDSHIAVKNA
jgi:hypothetical protein